MRYGLTMFATDQTMRLDDLAREAEARGFESLYVPEHTHIPTSRRTPPPSGHEELADEYRRTLDPFVALSWAAAATHRLRVGTGVCLVAQHDPVVLAKTVSTLDHLSGGRVTLGVGFGWNREEMRTHGVDYAQRREIVREKVLAIRELWASDEAAFEGEFVHFETSWQWPKPVQKPHPPVLIGGAAGPTLFRHIAEYGDGWIPIGGSGLADAIPRLLEQVAEEGRDPDTIEVVPFGSLPDPEKLEHFDRIGVTEVVFRVPSAGPDGVLPVLDRYADLLPR